MKQANLRKSEVQKKYNEKAWVFKSETFRIKNETVRELISKAYAVYFTKIIFEEDGEIIRLEHTQTKDIQYKFHKSVKNVASRKVKKGISKEIRQSLNNLKEDYASNPDVEDIEHYGKHIEVCCKSKTDSDLRINFRIHPKNINKLLCYDIYNRHYKEFFAEAP